MRIEDYPTEPRFTATVLSSERITEDASDVEVRELVLEVEEHQFNFKIGQSIGVLVSARQSLAARYTIGFTPSQTRLFLISRESLKLRSS